MLKFYLNVFCHFRMRMVKDVLYVHLSVQFEQIDYLILLVKLLALWASSMLGNLSQLAKEWSKRNGHQCMPSFAATKGSVCNILLIYRAWPLYSWKEIVDLFMKQQKKSLSFSFIQFTCSSLLNFFFVIFCLALFLFICIWQLQLLLYKSSA